eukprot:gene21418-27448_t
MPLFARLRTSFTNIPDSHLDSFPECVDVGSVFSELGLVASPTASQNSVKVFHLVKRPHLNNNIGKMHGGAVAAVVEQACYLSRSCLAAAGVQQNSITETAVDSGLLTPTAYRVQALEARYESAMEGDLVVTCMDDLSSPLLPCGLLYSRSVGTICNRGSDLICAEYVCTWA